MLPEEDFSNKCMSKNLKLKIFKTILYVFNYPLWVSKYLELILGFNTLKDIKILSIEFSSICNLVCKYCFLEQKERARFLDINIYEKLIKEVAENPRYKVKVMEWPISGEFFVYKEWGKVVDITKKYMDANSHFRPHVILNENLMLFDEEKINYILQSGVVKQIICSVDGHDAKTFEDMRPPAQWEKFLKNFRYLVRKNHELGHPVFLQINNGRDENSFHQELSEEMKEVFKGGDSVTLWNPQYWNESFNKKDKKFYPAKGFCIFVFNNVTLSSSGQIAKCCMDLKGSTVYADLAKHSLEEIWHSHVRRQFLNLMFKNQRRKIKGCDTCAITRVNNDNRYTNIIRTLKRKVLPMLWGKDYYLKPLQ